MRENRRVKKTRIGRIVLVVVILLILFVAIRSRANGSSRKEIAFETDPVTESENTSLIESAEDSFASSIETAEDNADKEETTVPSEIITIGVTPEFKEAMDSYEAFFDEYIAFMERFSESEDTSSMLAEYMEYMTRYTEVMEKLGDIGDQELSDADALYYAQVQLRVSEKLMASSVS